MSEGGDAGGDEFEGELSGFGGVPLDAFGEGGRSQRRGKMIQGGDQGEEVDGGLDGDEDLGIVGQGGEAVGVVHGAGGEEEDALGEEKGEGGHEEEQEGVAEVGDTRRGFAFDGSGRGGLVGTLFDGDEGWEAAHGTCLFNFWLS